jgi:hypothetical protein
MTINKILFLIWKAQFLGNIDNQVGRLYYGGKLVCFDTLELGYKIPRNTYTELPKDLLSNEEFMALYQ